MTGNNPELSKEIARRVVDIRLDAEMERPEDRPPDEFAIPDLKRWLREHRGKLVGACIATIQAWIDAGKSFYDERCRALHDTVTPEVLRDALKRARSMIVNDAPARNVGSRCHAG